MTTKTSPPAVNIKKEIANEEIKDFAETAMNELLGWYGYENVDRSDLSMKSSRCYNSNLNLSYNQHETSGNRNSQRDESTSERDSSREDSKSPSSSKPSEKPDAFCGWCHRLLPENSAELLTTTDGPRYCSESCFSQSRRASFKRAKTCDWCRHVRHAVSYVDFQDGASQLQFCSDKCLNQYKMQLFCRETQAHLDMNPHLKEKSSLTGSLITPDLWLKNCRSRSVSPTSEISRSSTPSLTTATNSTLTSTNTKPQIAPNKPVITVAPASKLLSKSTLGKLPYSQKHSRKKRVTRYSIEQNSSNDFNSLSRENDISSNKISCSNSISSCSKILNNNNLTITQIPPKPCTFPNLQDIRLGVPPTVSPADNIHQNKANNLPGLYQSPNLKGFHPSLMTGGYNRLSGLPLPKEPPRVPNFVHNANRIIPPPTLMVPFPVILPLPIPVPLPMPLIEFVKAARNWKINYSPNQSNQADRLSEERINNRETSEINEPLDFTKSNLKSPVEICDPINTYNREEVERSQSSNVNDSTNTNLAELKIPKLKSSRLSSKRLICKEAENSRPLRKRKRIIDCDYLKISKDNDDDDNNDDDDDDADHFRNKT